MHRMTRIQTRLYIRKSADLPVKVSVTREHIPRGGYILHFAAEGEVSDVEIWLSAEHAREVIKALATALSTSDE